MRTLTFAEDDTLFANPERGLGVMMENGGTSRQTYPLEDYLGYIERFEPYGLTTVLPRYHLGPWRDADLPQSLLDRIQGDFDTAREEGLKLVPRFHYATTFNFPYEGLEAEEDASPERVAGHLAQVAPILEANLDVLSFVEGGLIGPYGEQWNSINGNVVPSYDAASGETEANANTAAIYDALLEAVPDERMTTIRYTFLKRSLFGEDFVPDFETIDPEEAWTDAPRARVGFDNQAFLSDRDDYEPASGPWSYIGVDGKFTPGVVFPDAQAGAAGGFEDAFQNAATVEEMRAEIYAGNWDLFGSVPNEILGLELNDPAVIGIIRDMGYRLRLTGGAIEEAETPGGTLSLTLDIANDGSGSLFNGRDVEVVFRHAATGESFVHEVTLGDRGNLAHFPHPGETRTWNIEADVPQDAAPGDYDVLLALPDPHPRIADDPRYAIRLANEEVWEAAGLNDLGASVKIEENAPMITSDQAIALDDEAFITIDGERFFPYGFYVEDKGTRDVRETLGVLGAAGFNTVQIEPVDNEPMRRIFDKAAEEGIRVLYSPSKYLGPDGLDDVIADVSREPALLGWTVGDDVRDGDMTGRPRDVAEVKAFHDAILALDPDHLTFGSIGGGTTETIYDARAWDVSGQQIYPVNGDAPLNLVFGSITDVVAESAANGQTAVALLQAFDFDQGAAVRPPTPAEFDNMLYQALAAGAQGVIYYSYDNFGNGIEAFPDLWAAAVETADQIAVLEPFLLSGTHAVEDLGGDLVVATWEEGDALVAAVVYAGDYQSFADPAQNEFDTRTVTFDLPPGYEASAVQNLFADATFDLTNDGGTVTGEIDLLDVQVARFEKVPGDIIGAAGTASVRQSGPDAWTRVEFGATVDDAVVVVGPPTSNGAQPTSVRVRNVDATGFEVQLDEWDYLDGRHVREGLGWMALEAGVHALADGRTIQAGWAEGGGGWGAVDLGGGTEDPAVFATVRFPDASSALVPRLRDVGADGFRFRLDAEEAAGSGAAEGAGIGWIAVEAGPGGADGPEVAQAGRIDHAGAALDVANADAAVLLAAMQTTRGGDTATLRLDGPGRVFVEEERSRDAETAHFPEDVAVLAAAPGLVEGWQDVL